MGRNSLSWESWRSKGGCVRGQRSSLITVQIELEDSVRKHPSRRKICWPEMLLLSLCWTLLILNAPTVPPSLNKYLIKIDHVPVESPVDHPARYTMCRVYTRSSKNACPKQQFQNFCLSWFSYWYTSNPYTNYLHFSHVLTNGCT